LPVCPAVQNVTATPVYSAVPAIVVKWQDQPSETSYKFFLTVGVGTPTQVATLATNVTSWTDVTVNGTDSYTYDVEACISASCSSIGTFTTSVTSVATGEVLHGFNEVIAHAGVSAVNGVGATGYHDGVDINRSTSSPAAGDDVLSIRGGVVVDIYDSTAGDDDGFLAVKIDMGGGAFEYISFNHTANDNGNERVVCRGEVVSPGQKIAQVGRSFSSAPYNLGDFSDHVHTMIIPGPNPGDNTLGINNDRHLLTLFSSNSLRDRGSNLPELFDENNDGKNVLFRNHNEAVKTKYLDYDETQPFLLRLMSLSGDIDIHVEVTDQQGNSPRQAPIRLNYWIEGPIDNTVDYDDVMQAATPYKFHDFENNYLGAGTPVDCNLMVDIQNAANSGCQGLTTAAYCTTAPMLACNSIIKEGATSFPWPVLHHFIVTHAKDGVTPAVDANMYWRTKAKEDNSGATLIDANFAGKTEATKGSEARFPDGEYTLHFLASDLVNSNVDLTMKNVRLENYAPFIKEFIICQDRDGNSGTQFDAGYPGCELKLYEFTHKNPESYVLIKNGVFAGAAQTICIKLRFSEGMDASWPSFDVSLDLSGPGGAALIAFAGSFSKTYNKDDIWKGTVSFPIDASGGSDSSDSVISITARDLADRMGNFRGLDANDDGTGEADSNDSRHKIPTDARAPTARLQITP